MNKKKLSKLIKLKIYESETRINILNNRISNFNYIKNHHYKFIVNYSSQLTVENTNKSLADASRQLDFYKRIDISFKENK